MMPLLSRVLIIGLARSGTTWVGDALSASAATAYVDEPDNHYRHPFAFRTKLSLPGRAYPVLRDRDAAPEYARLWDCAFGLDGGASPGPVRRFAGRAAEVMQTGHAPVRWRGGRALVRRAYAGHRPVHPWLALAARLARPVGAGPGAGDVVVKSVYALRSAAWLAERLPVRVLVLRRDLRGVIASWKATGWLEDPSADPLDELGPGAEEALMAEAGAPAPRPDLSQVGRVTWFLACLASLLRRETAGRSDWTVVDYEQLVQDAPQGVPRLATDLGLTWSDEADARLRGPLAPLARSAGIDPRLSESEVEQIDAVLEGFDLRGWAW